MKSHPLSPASRQGAEAGSVKAQESPSLACSPPNPATVVGFFCHFLPKASPGGHLERQVQKEAFWGVPQIPGPQWQPDRRSAFSVFAPSVAHSLTLGLNFLGNSLPPVVAQVCLRGTRQRTRGSLRTVPPQNTQDRGQGRPGAQTACPQCRSESGPRGTSASRLREAPRAARAQPPAWRSLGTVPEHGAHLPRYPGLGSCPWPWPAARPGFVLKTAEETTGFFCCKKNNNNKKEWGSPGYFYFLADSPFITSRGWEINWGPGSTGFRRRLL